MYEIQKKIKLIAPYIQSKPEKKEWVQDPNGKWREITETSTIGKKSVDPEINGHKDEKGYFVPGRQIWAAMRERSGGVKLGKGRMTLKNLFISCIRIEPEKIYINKKKPDFIYNDPCFKKSAKGGEMVYNPRPAFNPGLELKITIIVLEDSIPEEVVIDCLKQAGLYQGIGSRHGEYGRFVVNN